ncbi:N-formylglutamate amidohydrolase [Rufibacter hautae]|uniref:N-formylglutamate amidohydrolase n=1 Tax=Rufibacter hautae TaxID=2595005 RepID=A0A5B6TEJ6_9BACT|nr:N-formylglutamate amidohydrolase [Rufibacter hautae]KAA3437612.1 N-formylglutamate amidohydrolase [Rufibacter hautae]
MLVTCILTCEHAGNDIPDQYQRLFKGREEELYSHKAIDFGALRLAKHLASAMDLSLFYTTYSRLLVEGNRSLESEELFSDFTKSLPEQEKQDILNQYYHPHRNEVEEKIKAATDKGHQVLHLAIHTFTPAKEGEVREADIGILFDTARSGEERYAGLLKSELQKLNPARKVLYNSPYPGVDDGFPTYLRKKFNNDQYAGFELEINQKFFLNEEPEVWRQLKTEMTAAVQAALGEGSDK